MPYTDTTLTCSGCDTAFMFTAPDQAVYAEKGFTSPPSRCSSCRHLNRIWPAGAPARPAS